MEHQLKSDRLDQEAGIAIGPILFIIAILGILAAAIAAGSGSFTSGTSSQSNSTKAAAMIQIGENLKIGMDRITMQNGWAPAGVYAANVVDLNTQDTSLNNALFAPTGGGISPPSTGMALNSSSQWRFVYGPVNGIGTGGAGSAYDTTDVLATIQVSQGVCAEINNKSVGVASAPTTGADLGNFETATPTAPFQMTTGEGLTNWGAMAGPALKGVAVGCVNNINTVNSGAYYFYQVLAVQ